MRKRKYGIIYKISPTNLLAKTSVAFDGKPPFAIPTIGYVE